MKKTFLYFLILLFFQTLSYGQQDAHYTQYMYNMSVINPAYTTNDTGLLNFGMLYRTQWVSAVGGPKSFNFFAHAALSEKIETGISIVSDQIGDGAIKENNIFADFAYNLKLNDESAVALGLKAGFTNFESNFNGFMLPEIQDDPSFNENINTAFPNIGIGAFYHRNQFYAGFSIPNLLNSQHLDSQNGVSSFGSEKMHMFLTAGYVYEINDEFKLKPSMLAKVVNGAPLSIDAGLNVLIKNKFEAGVAYRLDDAVSGMFNMRVLPAIRVGYAYDYTLSNLSDFSSGSHEIFVLFDLDLLGLQKGYDKSPRFY